jgi:hypothetical protein
MPTARHAPGAKDSKASHPTCTGAVIATVTPAAAGRFDGATINRRYVCVCSCHYAARNTARTAMCAWPPLIRPELRGQACRSSAAVSSRAWRATADPASRQLPARRNTAPRRCNGGRCFPLLAPKVPIDCQRTGDTEIGSCCWYVRYSSVRYC